MTLPDVSTLPPEIGALIHRTIAKRTATGLTVEIFTNGRLFVAHASSAGQRDRWIASARRQGKPVNILNA
jgi:hypothetical protein